MKKEYLSEEEYLKTKRKLQSIALVILIIGIFFGGCLITTGIFKGKTSVDKVVAEYNEEQKEKKEQLQQEKNEIQQEINSTKAQITALETEIASLETQLSQLTDHFSSEYMTINTNLFRKKAELATMNAKLTTEENSLKQKDKTLISSFDKQQLEVKKTMAKRDGTPFYMIGSFIMISSIIFGIYIYIYANGRKFIAFQAQQTMPLAQEGIEKITPTVANAGKTIAKEMAPAYKEVAKEISKGIKEGIESSKEEDSNK